MKFATAARIVTFVGMALSLHAGNASAANPGKSAMDCVSAARDKNDVVFTNNCGSKVFVVWCGEMKYSKQRCGDGPKGNSFYTHSNNIEAGKSIRANGIQEYRYAACHGGIAFGKDEIQDRPDGSFTCIASGAAARKPTAESTRTPATATASRPAPTATAQDSPLGTWLVTTDAGQKLKLTFSANGATYDDGEDQYPGRWSQQGRHISVQIFATEQHMRRQPISATALICTQTSRPGRGRGAAPSAASGARAAWRGADPQLHQHLRGMVLGGMRHDGRRQQVHDADVVVAAVGDRHVARQDAHAHAAADRRAAVAHPEFAAVELDARQVPFGIAFGHRGLEHGAGILAQADRQVDPRQGLGQRALRHGAAGVHDDDMVGQARDFVRGMADIDHGNVEFVAQAFQPGQEFLLARMVERGQRLVHQQQARLR
jgi:hypothetical protein